MADTEGEKRTTGWRPLDELIAQSEEDGGISIKKLPKGTRLLVTTQNSIYVLVLLDSEEDFKKGTDKGKIQIQGGSRFKEPKKVILSGSTWDGSAIKLRWIGENMCMELRDPSFTNGTLITSFVKSVQFLPREGMGAIYDEPEQS